MPERGGRFIMLHGHFSCICNLIQMEPVVGGIIPTQNTDAYFQESIPRFCVFISYLGKLLRRSADGIVHIRIILAEPLPDERMSF